MFGFTDSNQNTMDASSNRSQRTAPNRPSHHWEFDWSSSLVNHHSANANAHRDPSADELSLFLDRALALAG